MGELPSPCRPAHAMLSRQALAAACFHARSDRGTALEAQSLMLERSARERSGEISRGCWCPGAESNHRHGDFQSPLGPSGRASFPLGTSVKHPSRPVKAGTPKHGHARSAFLSPRRAQRPGRGRLRQGFARPSSSVPLGSSAPRSRRRRRGSPRAALDARRMVTTGAVARGFCAVGRLTGVCRVPPLPWARRQLLVPSSSPRPPRAPSWPGADQCGHTSAMSSGPYAAPAPSLRAARSVRRARQAR